MLTPTPLAMPKNLHDACLQVIDMFAELGTDVSISLPYRIKHGEKEYKRKFIKDLHQLEDYSFSVCPLSSPVSSFPDYRNFVQLDLFENVFE